MLTKIKNSLNILCLSSQWSKIIYRSLYRQQFRNHPKHFLINNLQYRLSSFKNDFNEQSQEIPLGLKQFEELINNFQTFYDTGKYQKLFHLMKKANCQKCIQYVEILLNIVVTCKNLNLNQKIISALVEADDILEELPQQNYTHKHVVYSHLQNQYYNLKDINNDIKYLKKLLQLYKKTNIESIEVVAINRKLGDLYSELNQFQSSIPYYQKALQLLDKKEGNHSQEKQTILSCLGFLYYRVRNLQKSLEVGFKMLKIQQSTSGKQTSNYVYLLKNIGVIFKEMRNNKKCIQCFEQALSIAAKSGKQSEFVANWVRQNLAITYFENQQFEKSLSLAEKAVSIISARQQRQKFLCFTKIIADCCKNGKQYEKARKKYSEILAILNERQEKSLDQAFFLSEIGLMYYNLNQYKEALGCYLSSVQIEESINGNKNQACASLYQNISELYQLLGDKKKSEEYLKMIDQSLNGKNPSKSF